MFNYLKIDCTIFEVDLVV